MSRYPKIDLAGALVAVTGSARGIGLATARAFHEAGATVALGDLDADLAAREAAALGDRASGHALDVTDKESFAGYLAAAEEQHGRPVEVLVNNAGIMPNGSFLDMPESLDRKQFDINVHGVIHGMRLVLPGMIDRGHGHVVNVASLAGKFPLKGLAVYNGTKFAVVGLSAATRLELEDTGVSLSTVLPSAVNTELSSGIDMGVLPCVEPEDIAAAVVRSVRTRAAEVSVPGYLGTLAKTVPLVPEPLMRRLRHLLDDDAAITKVDPEVRDRYLSRIGAR